MSTTQTELGPAGMLIRLTGTQEGRDHLKALGHKSGMPLIPVEENTTVGEVLDRLALTGEAHREALIALRRGDSLVWLGLRASGICRCSE